MIKPLTLMNEQLTILFMLFLDNACVIEKENGGTLLFNVGAC